MWGVIITDKSSNGQLSTEKLSSEEITQLSDDIYNKLQVLKESSNNDKLHEKIDKFTQEIEKINESPENVNIDDIHKLNDKISSFQNFIDSVNKNMHIDASRLVGLSDGIFSIVMTLLIFGITIPNTEIVDYSSFITFLSQLAPTMGVTIVSFIIIASLWVYHHEFIRLNKFNFLYLWINIFFLLSVSFIPFTTSLIGNYSHFFLSEIIFSLNILLAAVFFILMYYYAYKMNFLENKQSKGERKYTLNTFELIISLTVVINLLEYLISPGFIYLFLLMPLISTFMDLYKKIKI